MILDGQFQFHPISLYDIGWNFEMLLKNLSIYFTYLSENCYWKAYFRVIIKLAEETLHISYKYKI